MEQVDERSVPTLDVVDDGARIAEEVRRIYLSGAWVGPIGTAALTTIVATVLWDRISRPALAVWAAVLGVAVVVLFALPWSRRLRRWESPTGIPRLAYPAHLLIGVAYGALFWLDPAMTDVAELTWIGLMAMCALSAGVTSGLNGLNTLGLRVVVPTWLLGSLALMIGGDWLVGSGGFLFLAIQVVDQRRTGDLWREMVTLRVDEERRSEEQRWLAEHDTMTGLLNRAGMLRELEQRPGGPTTAMFVDLDHFKQVNDQYGHAAGDQVLVEVARRLVAQVRDTDAVARLGGDEFFIAFGDPLAPDRLHRVGRQILDAVHEPIVTSEGVAEVSVSIGAATTESEPGDPAPLMAHADHALLMAKRRGRNCVEIDIG